MTIPRVLMNCIRMHQSKHRALSGNFFHCQRLIAALQQTQELDLHVHVDQRTLPVIAPLVSADQLIVEDHPVDSIPDMEACIRKAVKRVRPDVYHKPTGQLPLLPITCPAVWGVADLGHRHLKMGRMQRLYKHISYRSSAKKAARIIAVSHSTRREIISALPVAPEKVYTVYHGTTCFTEDPSPVANLPALYAITFAHQRHKNVEKAIEAVAIARKTGTDLRLVVVGHLDYRDDLDRVAVTYGIPDDVMYTNHVSEGELRFLYENTLCLLFLSRHEGFGLPILEAMGAGCPVISSNAFSLPEVVGDAAPMFDCDDATGVAGAISQLANDTQHRQRAIARGHQNANRFSWERAAKETIAIYRGIS